jgi:hypothetical protein
MAAVTDKADLSDTFHEARATLGRALFPELATSGMDQLQQVEFARFRLWRVLLPCAEPIARPMRSLLNAD